MCITLQDYSELLVSFDVIYFMKTIIITKMYDNN